MTTIKLLLTCAVLFFSLHLSAQTSGVQKIKSPNGSIEICFEIVNGKALYSVNKNAKPVIKPSGMGFEFKNMPALTEGFEITGTSTSTFDETWEQPWGERRFIRNNYNELIVKLQEKNTPNRNLNITFRAFNDGIGFRYDIPKQKSIDSIIIADEKTGFEFPSDHKALWIPVHGENSYYESLYRNTLLSAIDTANTPITIETAEGLFLAVHEANLTEYASMVLLRTQGTHFTSYLVPWANGVKVYAQAPMKTPWRTIIIAEKATDLITSYMMLNLNEPCKLEDISWIKPSKYIGIWWGMHLEKYSWAQGPKHGATTENTMKYMDFAAAHGFSGVLVEGWNYGWDSIWWKNGNVFDFTKPFPDFDIEKVTAYGASKGVKLIGHHETGGASTNYENQLEDAFALYNRVGVNAVKTGYVNPQLDHKEWHDGQYAVRHHQKVVETAAKYQIMLDVHEPVKPTGLQRTFPNLMTFEGARGQEYDAWSADGGNPPSHTTILPFTRLLAGPMDFTPGTFNFENKANPKTRVQTTRAKQLALFVIMYSPLQMASDLPENYEEQAGFEFIKQVPCDWHETVALNGKPGEYVSIVRKDRNSDDWYLGAITNENARELEIDLTFLEPGNTYTAVIYADAADADWKLNPNAININSLEVTKSKTLKITMAPGGGQAIWFKKK